jgi:hypothetical protein
VALETIRASPRYVSGSRPDAGGSDALHARAFSRCVAAPYPSPIPGRATRVRWFSPTRRVMRSKADAFALNTAPIIEHLAAQGMSQYQIAQELIRRGVKSARGGDSWNSTAVRSVRERAARIEAERSSERIIA